MGGKVEASGGGWVVAYGIPGTARPRMRLNARGTLEQGLAGSDRLGLLESRGEVSEEAQPAFSPLIHRSTA